MSQFTVTVEKDQKSGDLVIEIPRELMALKGWQVGDTLMWIDKGNLTWALEKIDQDNQSGENKSTSIIVRQSA